MFRVSIIRCTKKLIKELNSVIYGFIWKGKDPFKRQALISDYKNGVQNASH